MILMKYSLSLPVLGLAAAGMTSIAHATQVPVSAQGVIYCPQSGSCAAGAGGIEPTQISIAGATSFTFSVTGKITLNLGTGTNYNDADGVGAAPSSSSNTGTSAVGGITAPGAGYLVGLFGGSSNTAGAATNYLAAGAESMTSYSPTLNQVFFVGDGLTGDGTGTTQTFYVPTGASYLYLGISDASGYNGGPSAYGDNVGSYTVNYTATSAGTPTPTSTTPEPSSLMLLGTGVLSAAGAIRRRVRR